MKGKSEGLPGPSKLPYQLVIAPNLWGEFLLGAGEKRHKSVCGVFLLGGGSGPKSNSYCVSVYCKTTKDKSVKVSLWGYFSRLAISILVMGYQIKHGTRYHGLHQSRGNFHVHSFQGAKSVQETIKHIVETDPAFEKNDG